MVDPKRNWRDYLTENRAIMTALRERVSVLTAMVDRQATLLYDLEMRLAAHELRADEGRRAA